MMWMLIFWGLAPSNLALASSLSHTEHANYCVLRVTGKHDYKVGTAVRRPSFRDFGVAPEDAIYFLGEGSEGRVYRVIPSNGDRSYLIKVFDAPPPEGVRAAKWQRDAYESERDVFLALNAEGESNDDKFKAHRLLDTFEGRRALKFADTFGFTLAEHPLLGELSRTEFNRLVADYRREIQAFARRLRAQGWTVRRQSFCDYWIHGVRFDGFECSRLGLRMFLSAKNVVVDFDAREFTLIDSSG